MDRYHLIDFWDNKNADVICIANLGILWNYVKGNKDFNRDYLVAGLAKLSVDYPHGGGNADKINELIVRIGNGYLGRQRIAGLLEDIIFSVKN